MRENPKSSRIRIASEIAVPASTFTFEWYYSQARPHSARLLHLPQSRSSQKSSPKSRLAIKPPAVPVGVLLLSNALRLHSVLLASPQNRPKEKLTFSPIADLPAHQRWSILRNDCAREIRDEFDALLEKARKNSISAKSGDLAATPSEIIVPFFRYAVPVSNSSQ